MNILILGSGGREHAFAWKIKQSNQCEALYIAPGNAGTASLGTNIDIAVTDFEKIKLLVLEKNIGMVVVGPEEPLVKGFSDFFASSPETDSIIVIGPSAAASQLEGSKAFAKAFMQKHGIPTAKYARFDMDNYSEGLEYIRNHEIPIVIKADGLAAGKGVLICNSNIEAMAEYELIINQSKFGDAGKCVVVESFLEGIEMSVFVLTDGKDYLVLPEAKDYKRVGEGDTGLNTGGMGAVSPLPFFDDALKQKIIDRIIEPTIKGLMTDNLDYKGFIFLGLMINQGEPMVIEYNCRMGDPETEVVIPRIKNDLVDLFLAVAEGRLKDIIIETDSRTAVTIVAASGGYPGNYEKGLPIDGLNTIRQEDRLLFHSGTKKVESHVVTNGGRVFAMTAYGASIREAAEKSVESLQTLDFTEMFYRSDIGYEFN